MKLHSRKMVSAIAAIAVLGICSVASAGDKANVYYEAGKLAKAPVLDGVVQAGEWDGTAVATFKGAVSPNSTKYRVGWMADALWFAVEVSDPMLFGTKTAYGDYVWEDDALEVFIDTENSSEEARGDASNQFLFSPAGGALVWQGSVWPPDLEVNAGISYAMKATGTLNNDADVDKGYVIEFKIPVSGLPGTAAFAAGKSIGLAIHNKARDSSGGEYEEVNSSAAMTTGQNPHNPATWGVMTLK